MIIEATSRECIRNQHGIFCHNLFNFLKEFLSQQVFGYVITTKSIENYIVILLSKNTGALYKHPSIAHCHAHVRILLKKEKFLRNIYYGLIDLNHVD